MCFGRCRLKIIYMVENYIYLS
ncbi:hypothetical protein Patl1_13862 [Pistacia atlantica]|uniref:Uncharacterized protein n=1 Tax=Pistacia atlantica TaxID=434234 RepID=A0ACC1ATH1_9ROSI|nr:hypothetical protein Patl1_13862 [Pistacia atlantica]